MVDYVNTNQAQQNNHKFKLTMLDELEETISLESQKLDQFNKTSDRTDNSLLQHHHLKEAFNTLINLREHLVLAEMYHNKNK